MDSEERIVAGIHFCNVCKNILTPNRANESVLEFKCRNCGKVDKDFTNASDQAKLVYSKTDETTFAEEARESDYLQDPTMPRVNITCPECDWNEAVYWMKAEKGETLIKVRMMCTRSKVFSCGHIWTLEQNELMPPRVH